MANTNQKRFARARKDTFAKSENVRRAGIQSLDTLNEIDRLTRIVCMSPGEPPQGDVDSLKRFYKTSPKRSKNEPYRF